MPRPRLDETDIEILKYLVKDARISQRALALEIGMSPPAIADRIARLEADGVIHGYGASSNLEAPAPSDMSLVSYDTAQNRTIGK